MRRPALLIIWLISDAALFLAAYVIAYFLRVGFIVSTDFPLQLYVQSVVIVTPLWLLVLAELGVFRLLRIQSERRNILSMLFGAIIGSALFTLTYYFLHDRFFSRLLLVIAAILSFVLPMIWHMAFDQWRRKILRASPPVFPVLIIGVNRDAERFIHLLEERQSPLVPVGILDAQGACKEATIAGIPVVGRLHKLEDALRSLRPTHLVHCSNLEHSINLLSACRNHGITYMLLPSVLGIMGGKEEFVWIEGQPMAMVRE